MFVIVVVYVIVSPIVAKALSPILIVFKIALSIFVVTLLEVIFFETGGFAGLTIWWKLTLAKFNRIYRRNFIGINMKCYDDRLVWRDIPPIGTPVIIFAFGMLIPLSVKLFGSKGICCNKVGKNNIRWHVHFRYL